jgi:hypothetical protein
MMTSDVPHHGRHGGPMGWQGRKELNVCAIGRGSFPGLPRRSTGLWLGKRAKILRICRLNGARISGPPFLALLAANGV